MKLFTGLGTCIGHARLGTMWGACVVYIGLHVGLNTSGVFARFVKLGAFNICRFMWSSA